MLLLLLLLLLQRVLLPLLLQRVQERGRVKLHPFPRAHAWAALLLLLLRLLLLLLQGWKDSQRQRQLVEGANDATWMMPHSLSPLGQGCEVVHERRPRHASVAVSVVAAAVADADPTG